MIAINIDTSRISKLALSPRDPDHMSLIKQLEHGSTYVVVCFTRIRELTRADADAKRQIVDFLRNVPTLLGQPESVLEASELEAACARAVGRAPGPARPFAIDSGDWGSSDQSTGHSAADILEKAGPQIMQDFRLRLMADAADDAARSLGANSIVVQDGSAPARSILSRHVEQRRAVNEFYAHGLSSDEIFERAGGLSALPSIRVVTELRAARLSRRNPAEKNDMFDEDIARFHPYSAVSILDNATTTRFWSAQVYGFERVVSEIGRASEILDRVRRGDLVVSPSIVPGAS